MTAVPDPRKRFTDRVADYLSVSGSAEATGLPAAYVDLLAAGQAFHWFDVESALREARRILRPPGWTVLFWNTRKTGEGDFAREYADCLRNGDLPGPGRLTRGVVRE